MLYFDEETNTIYYEFNITADADSSLSDLVELSSFLIYFDKREHENESVSLSLSGIDFAKTIKQKTGNIGIYIQEPADFWAQQAILESNGARMLTEKDGKTRATFALPEGIEAFEAYADMVLKDKSALHISWDKGMQSFVSGDVAMAYTTIARRASIQEQAEFNVGAVKSPVWEGKERAIPAGGCFLAITAKDEEQQKAAWEFIKFLYSVESMAEWTIGNGYVSPRQDVAESENGLKDFLKENQLMTLAIEQMDGVRLWASFPGDVSLVLNKNCWI